MLSFLLSINLQINALDNMVKCKTLKKIAKWSFKVVVSFYTLISSIWESTSLTRLGMVLIILAVVNSHKVSHGGFNLQTLMR